jgi:hypothetical protein
VLHVNLVRDLDLDYYNFSVIRTQPRAQRRHQPSGFRCDHEGDDDDCWAVVRLLAAIKGGDDPLVELPRIGFQGIDISFLSFF